MAKKPMIMSWIVYPNVVVVDDENDTAEPLSLSPVPISVSQFEEFISERKDKNILDDIKKQLELQE